ncbi:MAG: SNF2-related protein [Bacteroidota bacterium]
MRSVDANLPFRVVYSIYHHEYLGHLISANYVQELGNGELSLVHQGAHPGTLAQFASALDQTDEWLIQKLAEIKPQAIVKRFKGDPRALIEFFTQKYNGQIETLAQSFIQKRLAEVLPALRDRFVSIMGNDGYPAQEPVEVIAEEASVHFHFKRLEDETRYYTTVFLNGERVMIHKLEAQLICLNPAWILRDKQLFSFEKDMDGKKLRPFVKKHHIAIPRQKEEEFFRKFVPQVLEKYTVIPEGFAVEKVKAEPEFSILVKDHNSSFSFVPQVSYDRFTLPLRDIGKVKAFMEKTGEDFTFYTVQRDDNEEKRIVDLLKDITPNGTHSMTPWQNVEKDRGLTWLSANTQFVQQNGIEIRQENQQYRIQLDRPEMRLTTKEDGDWFDIQAVVLIGGYEIPFIKFRNHILRSQREYKLPDGTIAILPEDWFSDYRHLLEVSEEREADTISIKKYQAPLLNFPSRSNGMNRMFEALQVIEEIPHIDPPTNLHATLRNYQAEGFKWLAFMKESNMGGILADDMGLGKTLQTLTLLQKELENGVETASLIVLPTSLIQNWQNEAHKFTPNLRIFQHTGINRPRNPEVFAQYNLILTTYGIVRQDIEMLKEYPFHFVILDESQMIKNPDSKTSKSVRKLIARHRLSLTGTPIENTVMDIWSQMAFLNPGLLGSESFFKKFYVSPIEKDKDPKRSAKLRRIIYPFILRRKKQQVEKDLPDRIEKLHHCGMTDIQQELYEETRSSYRNYLMELISQGAWKKNKLNILTGLQKLRQIAIHPQLLDKEAYSLKDSGKYLEVKRLLRQVLNKKRSKVLIFSQFVKMLHLLRDDLLAEGIAFNYLDGSTKDRQKQVDTFQNDPSIKVFLISLKAGGVGLNLTAADYVFILDPWWNPAVENQAIDRSHRIGQDRTVFYYKFITSESIEEKILNLQRKKAQLSDDIITVEEDMYKSLDAVDLEDLLTN